MGARDHVKLLIGLSLIIIIVSAVATWHFLLTSSNRPFLWKQESVFGFDNFGTSTYKDNVLYAPSKGNNKVYAINASNGGVIWSQEVRQCDGSPYIDTDVIYVGECSGPNGEPTPAPKAMALKKDSGEVEWSFVEPSDTPWVGSPVVNGELVYYTTLGTGIYALNKTNGNPVWHQNVGKVVCSAAYDNGLVFVSANDPPGQYAFSAMNGEIVWNESYGSSWDSSPVVYEGTVVQVAGNVTRKQYSTFVLNETTGQLIRRFEGRGGQSTPLVHGGEIFIPSQNCAIWAYDLTTGTELWHTTNLTTSTPNLLRPDLSYCSPLIVNGTIYYQSLSGTFYAIDEKTGNTIWSRELGSDGFGSPSVGDGKVFITNDSALYAFEIATISSEWPMFCKNSFHQSFAG
jgi:outer membrane protein assembly factor BamB